MFRTFSSSDEQRNIGMNSNSETSCVAVDGFGAKTIILTALGIVTRTEHYNNTQKNDT
jgi:hypothetical protein